MNAVSDSTVGKEATDEGGVVTDRKKTEDGFKNNKSQKEGYKGHAKEGYNSSNRGDPSREGGYKGQGYYKGPYKGQGYNKQVPQEGQYDHDAPSTAVVSGKVLDRDAEDPAASDEGRVAAFPQDGPPPPREGSRDYGGNEGYKKGYYKEGYNSNRGDPSREGGYKGQGYYKGPYKGQGYNKEDGYNKEYHKPRPKPIAAADPEKSSPAVRRTDENARAKILEILNVPTTSYIIQEPLENTPDEAVDDHTHRPPHDGAKPRANYNGPKPRGNKEPYTTRPQDVGTEGYGRGRQVRVTRDQNPPRPNRAHHNAPEQDDGEGGGGGGWGADTEWGVKPKHNSARSGVQDIPEPVESSHGADPSEPPPLPPVSDHDEGGASSRYNGRQQYAGPHGGGGRDNGNKGRSVFGSVVKSHLVQENKQKVSALIKMLSTNRDCFTYCYRAYDVQHICYS